MESKNIHYMREKAEQGFTLVEVLIVIVVFSIGLLALSAMQFSATKGNASAYKLTEATNVASSQLEAILSAAYSDPILSVGTHTMTTNGYSIAYTVDELEANKIKKISLTITRTDNVVRSNSYDLIVVNIQ